MTTADVGRPAAQQLQQLFACASGNKAPAIMGTGGYVGEGRGAGTPSADRIKWELVDLIRLAECFSDRHCAAGEGTQQQQRPLAY